MCLENFPFVGWSRGWYAEDTENNYDSMASSLNGNVNALKEENNNSKMYDDLNKTIRGAYEMALLVKRNRYDQNILDEPNTKYQIPNTK